MHAYLGVLVDNATRNIHVKSVDCKCVKHNLKGGHGLFRKAIEYYASEQFHILDEIAFEFFGPDWKLTCPAHSIPRVEDSAHIHFRKWAGMLNNYIGPLSKTIAYFDLKKDLAATKIQAAFRGWRVRMKYRYNPYNRLGKYVIIRAGGF